jgi:ABC-2 type transport system ATP-binding protein
MPPEAADNVIETIHLTKVFRDFWHRPKVRALDRLSFEVRRGEVFGLLGPNGSGKSTTIKLLLGLLFPTSGAVRVLDRSPRDVRVKQRIGFLPEETYLYPYLNADETLDFFGRLNQLPRGERRRRVGALIEMVGLGSARNRPLREYSKGMARRIGIAQALINDPELILLDEPTTGLDPLGSREVKDLITELRRRGKSILLCSHLLADVEDVCDRIGILYAGRLCARGEVKELLARQQVTQITIPDLSPDGLARIRPLLQEAAGGSPVEIGHPLDRLESFFLRVIREARAAQPASDAVAAGRFDASLFREEPQAAEVIARLTRRAEEKPPEPGGAGFQPVSEPTGPPGKMPVPPPPESDVLQRLMAAPAPPAAAPAEPEPEAAAPDTGEQEQRRAILDRLVGKPSQSAGRKANDE